MQVVFEPPTKDSPGFLRRMKQALHFQDAVNSGNMTEATVENMVSFLSDYVKEPKDKEEARNLLYDASQSQFTEMLQAITGQSSEEDTKKNENGSSSGLKGRRNQNRLTKSKHSQ